MTPDELVTRNDLAKMQESFLKAVLMEKVFPTILNNNKGEKKCLIKYK